MEAIDYEQFIWKTKIWAKKKSDHKPIHARDATKADGPFYCPDTQEEVIVRKCHGEKIDHFAYKARLSPVVHRGETKLHRQCKEAICEYMQSRFPEGNWAIERPIPANKTYGLKEQTPDVSGRLGNTKEASPVAIEVQNSSLAISSLRKRTEGYAKRNVAVIWLVPLLQPLGNDHFRPRLFERYLHSMYYGRTYYWVMGQPSTIYPIHYGTADRYIEVSEWYDENGNLETAGGFYKPYKRIKEPLHGAALDLVDGFKVCDRASWSPTNHKMEVPACKLLLDNLDRWWEPEPNDNELGVYVSNITELRSLILNGDKTRIYRDPMEVCEELELYVRDSGADDKIAIPYRIADDENDGVVLFERSRKSSDRIYYRAVDAT